MPTDQELHDISQIPPMDERPELFCVPQNETHDERLNRLARMAGAAEVERLRYHHSRRTRVLALDAAARVYGNVMQPYHDSNGWQALYANATDVSSQVVVMARAFEKYLDGETVE